MKRYTGLIVLSLLLLGMLIGIEVWREPREAQTAAAMEEKESPPVRHAPVYTRISAAGRTFFIEGWEDENGSLYLFLPGWMEKKKKITIYAGEDITVDDNVVQKGGSFMMGEGEVTIKRREKVMKLNIMVSSGLPVLWLETEDKSLEEINRSKENIGRVRAYMLHGASGDSNDAKYTELPASSEASSFEQGGVIGNIHPRGNVSFEGASKKSYLLETENRTDFMGMGAARKWVLTSNYFDQTLLRNYLTLQLAAEMELSFVPEAKFVDLYVNGSYIGNYLLSEKVEVDPQRVSVRNLEEENRRVNSGPLYKKYPYQSENRKGFRSKTPGDITGGYLVEFEMDERFWEGDSGFVTRAGQSVLIQSPEHATMKQVNYIAGLFQELEDSLTEEPESDRYLDYIDLDSFAGKYLIEEVSKNIDANKTSQYFYKYDDSVSSKLFAGPVWDYDKAWGNMGKLDTDIDMRDPEKLYANAHIYAHSIWVEMCGRASFYQYVKEMYFEKMIPALEVALDGGLAEWKDSIYASAAMDQKRWSAQRKTEIENDEESYEAAFDRLVRFVQGRKEFLEREWKTR